MEIELLPRPRPTRISRHCLQSTCRSDSRLQNHELKRYLNCQHVAVHDNEKKGMRLGKASISGQKRARVLAHDRAFSIVRSAS
eukprot:6199266-Pleurochrysis_carterae.AAC.7